jgi:hypothetical protein
MNIFLFQLGALISKSEIGLAGPTSDKGVIKNVLFPVYFWAAALAVIVIVAAGFMYVLSSGDAAKVGRAKNAIIGAVVGLIVVLMAFTITNIILGSLS